MEGFKWFSFVVFAVLGAESSVVRKNTRESVGVKDVLVWGIFTPRPFQSVPEMVDEIPIPREDFLDNSDNDEENTQGLPMSDDQNARDGEMGASGLICYSDDWPTLKKVSCTGSCYVTSFWTTLGHKRMHGCSPQHHNSSTEKARSNTRYCNTNLCNL